MNYWLLKSEPETYSWQDQKNEGTTKWDGVRNYQARNNMQKMKLGDLCFFYHSGKPREIVGIVKVVQEYYPDDQDPRFGNVNVCYVADAQRPLTLAEIKNDPLLSELALVKQSRLSVMPVCEKSWQKICAQCQISLS